MQFWQKNSIRITRKNPSWLFNFVTYFFGRSVWVSQQSLFSLLQALESCGFREGSIHFRSPSPRHERNPYKDTNISDKFTFWINRTILRPRNTILTPWSSFVDSRLSLKNLWASEEGRTSWRPKIWIYTLEFSFSRIHSSTCSQNSRKVNG